MTTELQEKINSVVTVKDVELAVQLISQLRTESQLDMGNKDILKLFYIRINSLSTEQVYEVMKASIMVAYEIEDYDLHANFVEYLVQYNYVPEEIELCKRVIKLIETSQESLAGGSDTTVGSLVQDYTYNLGRKKRDALALMQYINSPGKTSRLDASQKDIVKNILELYDYCQDTVLMWNQLPEEINEEELQKLPQKFDWAEIVLGLDEFDPFAVSDISTKSSDYNIFHKPIPQDLEYIKPAEPNTQRTPSPKNPVHLTDSSDLDDMMKRVPRQKMGVVRDPTNIKIADEKQRLEQEQNIQAKRIQQKLSELRKRNTKL